MCSYKLSIYDNKTCIVTKYYHIDNKTCVVTKRNIYQ